MPLLSRLFRHWLSACLAIFAFHPLAGPGSHAAAPSITRADNALSEAPFPFVGPSRLPFTMALRGDSVFIGGIFKGADDIAAASLLMWDGKAWSDPFPGIPYGIQGLKWAGDRLYATGFFQKAGDVACDQAAYWEKGSWHAMGPGLPEFDFPGPMALLGDTLFTASRSGVYRWTDSSWVRMGGPLAGEPYRLENFGGSLWLSGNYGSDPDAANLMRWDGSVWTKPAGTDLEKIVDIAWHDGALFMTEEIPVGAFITNRISRWDGSEWTDVTGSLFGNFGRMASNGKEFFYTYHLFNEGFGIAKWDGNEFRKNDFVPGSHGDTHILAFTTSGKLILAGNLSGIGNERMDYMASWDGKVWKPLSAIKGPLGVSQSPAALGSDGNRLFLGGHTMEWAGPHRVSHAAAYDGAVWDTLGGGLRNPEDNRLVEVHVWKKGPLGMYAGGWFPETGSGPALNVARWDGKGWHSLGKGFPGRVSALLPSGDDMIVGGQSDSSLGLGADALPAGQALGRWDGSRWLTYGQGLAGSVKDLAEYEGNLYAAGRFRILPAGPVCGLAKWDGAEWKPVPNSVSDTLPLDSVYALEVFKGRLYAMGRETKWEFPWDEALMAWNGAAWERVDDILQGTDMMTDGSALYLQFTRFIHRPEIGFVQAARFDGEDWILLGTEAALSDIKSIGLHGGYLYLGGWLSTFGDKPASWLARWNIQSMVSVKPKRAIAAREGKVARKYFLIGDAAPEGMELFGLDGKRIDSRGKPGRRLRAGPAVGIGDRRNP